MVLGVDCLALHVATAKASSSDRAEATVTIPEELRQLIEANEILLAGLRAVEVHHVAVNARAGRDEAQSVTLRIVREALAKSGATS